MTGTLSRPCPRARGGVQLPAVPRPVPQLRAALEAQRCPQPVPGVAVLSPARGALPLSLPHAYLIRVSWSHVLGPARGMTHSLLINPTTAFIKCLARLGRCVLMMLRDAAGPSAAGSSARRRPQALPCTQGLGKATSGHAVSVFRGCFAVKHSIFHFSPPLSPRRSGPERWQGGGTRARRFPAMCAWSSRIRAANPSCVLPSRTLPRPRRYF